MRKISIKDKLILTSLSLSIFIILIVGSYSFYNAKNIVLNRTFNQLTSVRTAKTNLLKQFFKSCITEVQLAKSSQELISILQTINKKNYSSDFELFNDTDINFKNLFLNNIRKESYSRILIVGKNNSVYFPKNNLTRKNPNDSDLNFLRNKLPSTDSIYIQDYQKKDTAFTFITLSSAIKDPSGKISGFIIFEISPESIDDFMLENSSANGLGESGESYLVGGDFLMRSTSRFKKNSLFRTSVKTDVVYAALSGKTGTSIITDYRGVKVLSSYGKINLSGLQWVILAEIDYKEAMVPIYNVENEVIFINIFIFLIILIIVLILSERLTRPIKKLNKAVCEVGKGNYKNEISNKSNDEIGELTENFVKMSEKIQNQTIALQKGKIQSLSLMIDGQEKERQRLSRELHDSLGQLLIALKLKYESNLGNAENDQESEDGLRKLFDKTIDETRRISNNLMPAVLGEFGLYTAVRNMCNELSDISKIQISADFEGDEKKISGKTGIYIFRIIQEGLINILKHSEAERAKVKIHVTNTDTHIVISDNGKGIDENNRQISNSNGLNNISDRVTLLNGNFTVRSQPLKGTDLIIKIPLNRSK